MSDADYIIRTLAAIDPAFLETPDYECPLCSLSRIGIPYEEHRPDCPWRMAREWVAQQMAPAWWDR